MNEAMQRSCGRTLRCFDFLDDFPTSPIDQTDLIFPDTWYLGLLRPIDTLSDFVLMDCIYACQAV